MVVDDGVVDEEVELFALHPAVVSKPMIAFESNIVERAWAPAVAIRRQASVTVFGKFPVREAATGSMVQNRF
jgi:hypothetical protein